MKCILIHVNNNCLGDSYIWMNPFERMPGHYEGQLYSYPARRWKKKRRQYLMNDNYLTRRNRENETTEDIGIANVADTNGNRTENGDSFEKFIDDSKEAWLRDYDDGSDLPDAGELDDPESDYDDYEEYSSRKKKKKKDTPKRKRIEYTDAEKPYSCDICGARYKTRPGLSYHYSHSHQNESGGSASSGPGGGSGSSGSGRGSSTALEDDDMPYTPPRQMHHPPQAPSSNMPPGPHPQNPSLPLMSSHMHPGPPHGQQHSSSIPAPMRSNDEIEGKCIFTKKSFNQDKENCINKLHAYQ